MKKLYLLVREVDGWVQGSVVRDDADAGPVKPYANHTPDGFILIADEWAFSRKGRRDTEAAFYRNDGIEWEETATVDELRSAKNAEINATREAVNSSTFLFRGKAIQCHPLDRSDIDGTNGYVALFGTFPDEWMGAWKCADNSYVPITTVDDWKEFYKAMVDTGRANFRYAQLLKGRLAAATTAEEIAAITWETPIV